MLIFPIFHLRLLITYDSLRPDLFLMLNLVVKMMLHGGGEGVQERYLPIEWARYSRTVVGFLEISSVDTIK